MATTGTKVDSTRLRDRAATIADDVHQVRDAAKRVATDSTEAIRDTAREYIDEGKKHVRQWGDQMYTRVSDRPLKAVLIAAGIGFLLGAIWTRR